MNHSPIDAPESAPILVALAERGWTLAISEAGTDGALVALLRGMAAMRREEVVADEPGRLAPSPGDAGEPELREAELVRSTAGADVGLAIRAGTSGTDTPVTVAVVSPAGNHAETRLAFQRGRQGADRAALNGAAVLLAYLRGISRG